VRKVGHLKIDAEGLWNPTMRNSLLQQTGPFFIAKKYCHVRGTSLVVT